MTSAAFTPSLVPLQVVALNALIGITAELLQWAFVFRTRRFRALRDTVRRNGDKLEAAAKAAPAGPKGKKKDRALASWREDAAKQIAAARFRAGLIVSAAAGGVGGR